MLTGLRLGNFKAFGETQNIPIKPLTLIFGANSAGKSSIIHGLLLARHSSETGNLDAHKIKISGDAVDLGGFQQYVHRRDTSKQLEWGLSLDLSKDDAKNYVSAKHTTIPDTAAYHAFKTLSRKVGLLDVIACFSWSDDNLMPVITDYKIYADKVLLAHLLRGGADKINRHYINCEHPLFALVWESIREDEENSADAWGDHHARPSYEEFFADYDEEYLSDGLETLKSAGLYDGNFLPSTYYRMENHFIYQFGIGHDRRREAQKNKMEAINMYKMYTGDVSHKDAPSAVAPANEQQAIDLEVYRRMAKENYGIQSRIEDVVSLIVKDVANVVASKLNSIDYTAPLRVVPSRHFASLDNQHSSWYAGGSEWDYVRRNLKVREAVNGWLGASKMKSPYQLQVRRYRSDDRRTDVIEELVLHDKRFDTYVSPKDVGFGISQVLPVLVSAYGSENQIIAIEQPEIHLHPALQAELGDVFIESALGERKNTFLLETHSEHLILRIMRRMRDTVRGTLPDGMPPVRPEDVAILYVDRKDDDSTSVVSVLELDEEGQLLDPWPGGFFEEGFNERFA